MRWQCRFMQAARHLPSWRRRGQAGGGDAGGRVLALGSGLWAPMGDVMGIKRRGCS